MRALGSLFRIAQVAAAVILATSTLLCFSFSVPPVLLYHTPCLHCVPTVLLCHAPCIHAPSVILCPLIVRACVALLCPLSSLYCLCYLMLLATASSTPPVLLCPPIVVAVLLCVTLFCPLCNSCVILIKLLLLCYNARLLEHRLCYSVVTVLQYNAS